ncbi:MAG: hypothetical protein VKL39_12565 [Leptolyngbyaceae bacterium]|nr:hypothetical protein [Leptolyngbyaceae bacterium]
MNKILRLFAIVLAMSVIALPAYAQGAPSATAELRDTHGLFLMRMAVP